METEMSAVWLAWNALIWDKVYGNVDQLCTRSTFSLLEVIIPYRFGNYSMESQQSEICIRDVRSYHRESSWHSKIFFNKKITCEKEIHILPKSDQSLFSASEKCKK